MNKICIALCCSFLLLGCTSMNVKPTVGVHAGTSL
ncbi:hypothetical protein SAMN05216500_12124 [Acinetobacter sp. DSM 11652]|nr:hypothetical protein SAMN05216500_12124 [Acinetobacter sp. DSM 11652]